MFLGVVIKASPLEIDVNGTVQKAEDGTLWCNPALLPAYTRAASIKAPSGEIAASFENPTGEISASVDCGLGAISKLTATGSGSLSGTLSAGTSGAWAAEIALTTHGFAAGDRLLLVTQDQQSFYIVCKEAQL